MSNELHGGRGPAALAADVARRQREQLATIEVENAARRKALDEARAKLAERAAAVGRVENAGQRLFTSDRQYQQDGIVRSLAFVCGWTLPSKGVTEAHLREWAETVSAACQLIRSHEADHEYRSLNRESVVAHLTYHTTNKNDPPADHVPREIVADFLNIAWGLLDGAFRGSEVVEDVVAVWRDAPIAVLFAHNILASLYREESSEGRPSPSWSWLSNYLPPPPADGVHAPRPGVKGAWEWFAMRMNSQMWRNFPPDVCARVRPLQRNRELERLSAAVVAGRYTGAVNALSPAGFGGRELAVALLQRAVRITQTDPKAWSADETLRRLLAQFNDDNDTTARHARQLFEEKLRDEILELGPDYVVKDPEAEHEGRPNRQGRPASVAPEVVAEVERVYEKGTKKRAAILKTLQELHAGREPFMALTVKDVGKILDARRKRNARPLKKPRRKKGR